MKQQRGDMEVVPMSPLHCRIYTSSYVKSHAEIPENGKFIKQTKVDHACAEQFAYLDQ